MKQPDFWKNKTILGFILRPLSFIYRAATIARKATARPYRAKIPVICVGNVTVGGAGKTPVCLAIAKLLSGRKLTFLSRGYGGSQKGTYQVDSRFHNAQQTGDEPLLLSRVAPVVIAAKRKEGAIFAYNHGAEIIIMDDGLQNPTIEKDLSLLVIDDSYGLGNGEIMPAGPLREPLESGLKKASAVIFIGEDKHNLLPQLGDITIIRADLVPTIPHKKDGKPYIAFAGIANPDKFFVTLHQSGYDVVEMERFPDHYNYKENDVAILLEKAKKHKAALITTEKDFVRLNKQQQGHVEVLPVEIKWRDESAIKEILQRL